MLKGIQYTQTYDVDYFGAFSPLACLNSICILISLTINFEWHLYQLDLKYAFLYGDLSEVVYMKQPPRFVTQGESKIRICKLNRAIFRLKQSSPTRFNKLSIVILSFGFRRCNSNHSLFVLKRETNIVVLIVYVNDIIVSSSDAIGVEKVKDYLKRIFQTSDLELSHYFLGLKLHIVEVRLFCPKGNMHWICIMKMACEE